MKLLSVLWICLIFRTIIRGEPIPQLQAIQNQNGHHPSNNSSRPPTGPFDCDNIAEDCKAICGPNVASHDCNARACFCFIQCPGVMLCDDTDAGCSIYCSLRNFGGSRFCVAPGGDRLCTCFC